MADKTPLKLVDLGSGQGALKEFEAGDTLPAVLMPSKADSGVNADIAELTGLTTPLSIGQGGTNGNTQAAARTGLGLGTAAVADILGLVLSGAIIEAGSNANGDWLKLQDGTMIITSRTTQSVSMTLPYGTLFYGVGAAVNYPQAFVGALPRLYLGLSNGPVGAIWPGRPNATTLTNTGAFMAVVPGSVSGTLTVDVIAYGRWKV